MIFDFETWSLAVAAAVVLLIFLSSIYSIGPTEVGLVRKRFGAKLPGDNPLAFQGEAGYQAEMLMPGLRFKLWLVFAVTKHPWVQVCATRVFDNLREAVKYICVRWADMDPEGLPEMWEEGGNG